MGNRNYEASLRASVTPTFEASRSFEGSGKYVQSENNVCSISGYSCITSNC